MKDKSFREYFIIEHQISLEEISTSKLVQNFTDDSTFAIISACRPDMNNKARTLIIE